MIIEIKPELFKMTSGKINCERHNSFKMGGKEKNYLNWTTGCKKGIFTDEQEMTITNKLLEMLCPKENSNSYFNYIIKVLLSET